MTTAVKRPPEGGSADNKPCGETVTQAGPLFLAHEVGEFEADILAVVVIPGEAMTVAGPETMGTGVRAVRLKTGPAPAALPAVS